MKPLSAARRLATLVAGLWLAPGLAAQEVTQGPQTGALGGTYFAQLLGGLVVVLAAILILSWALKRINRLPGSDQRKLEITGTLSLGQRERLVSVRCGDLELLLGVTAGSIAALHVVENPGGPSARNPGTGATGHIDRKTDQ